MKLKLYIIGFFFCLIAAIGVVSISDSQKPVPLPIDGAFSIQGKSNLSSNEIYKMISKISKTNKVKIYKPIIQSSGKLIYINFDDTNYDQLKSGGKTADLLLRTGTDKMNVQSLNMYYYMGGDNIFQYN